MDTKTIVTYEINPVESSRFSLAVAKTGMMAGKKHNFMFNRYHGAVEVDHENRENSHVKFVVEAESVICLDTWIKENDKRKVLDYIIKEGLLAEKHPEIVFMSTKVKQKSDTTFDVLGTLEVRGIVKQISVELSLQPGRSAHLEMMGITNFKLSDYNIKPPSLLFGLTGTRDEIVVDFELVAKPR